MEFGNCMSLLNQNDMTSDIVSIQDDIQKTVNDGIEKIHHISGYHVEIIKMVPRQMNSEDFFHNTVTIDIYYKYVKDEEAITSPNLPDNTDRM